MRLLQAGTSIRPTSSPKRSSWRGLTGPLDWASESAQEGHQILLLLRRQLCAEDQVEELDGVFQRQKTLIVQVGRVVLGAAQRKGFDRAVADRHHVVDHHRLEKPFGLQVVHLFVGSELTLMAPPGMSLAEVA